MALNIEYVDLLIDYLRENPQEFHVEFQGVIDDRRDTCALDGLTLRIAYFRDELPADNLFLAPDDMAAKILGLTENQAERIFAPAWPDTWCYYGILSRQPGNRPTAEDAVYVLEELKAGNIY